MPDILSQLPPDTSVGPLGAPPGAPSPVGGPLPAPAPEPAGGGLGGFLGGLTEGLQQASPMLIAAVVGQQFGPEAMGAFMAGITNGQIQRAQLMQQQQRIDFEGERLELARGEIEEQKATRQAAAQGAEQKRQEAVVEDEIEKVLGPMQTIVQSLHPNAAYDMKIAAKTYLENVLRNNPLAAARYSPEEIERRMPDTVIQAAYAEQANTTLENIFKVHKDAIQQAFARGGQPAVDAFIENLPGVNFGDEELVPVRELMKKYGPGSVEQFVLTIPQPEQETITVQEDVAGAPPGTRQTRIIPKPSGEIPEEGVIIGGRRTPRPPQPPAAFITPTLREVTDPSGAKRLVPIIPGQLPKEGIQAEPAPEADPGKELDRLIDQMILDAFKGAGVERKP